MEQQIKVSLQLLSIDLFGPFSPFLCFYHDTPNISKLAFKFGEILDQILYLLHRNISDPLTYGFQEYINANSILLIC